MIKILFLISIGVGIFLIRKPIFQICKKIISWILHFCNKLLQKCKTAIKKTKKEKKKLEQLNIPGYDFVVKRK